VGRCSGGIIPMKQRPPVRFDECPICERIPRKLFQWHCGSHDQPEVPAHYFPDQAGGHI
jgi:hypothetical protein